MDLKDLDTTPGADQGFEFELAHPTTAAPLGMFITVLGRDSDTFTRLQNEQNRRRLDRSQKLSGSSRMSLSLEEMERDAIDLFAACTTGWRRATKEGEFKTLLLDGEELPCSKAHAIKVYTRFKWIREQVDATIVDRSNFLKR